MKITALALLSAAVLTGCAGSPSATPTATVAHTVTAAPSPTPAKTTAIATPTPAPVQTSGNYGADLAAAGVVPDDVKDYGDFMADYMCESSLTQASAIGSFNYGVDRFGKPGGEATGTGPAVVRLTVAYYCPERAAAAEKQLKALGYVK